MTQDDRARPAVSLGPHPYVCPSCGLPGGVLNAGTRVSECPTCGAQWRGPRGVLSQPPTDEADFDAWAQAMMGAVLGGD